MRDVNLLHPIVRDKALKLQQLAATKLDLKIIFTTTLRSAEEQLAYYAQGRQPLVETNKLRKTAGLAPINEVENKKIITKAKTVASSFHNYGLAFDIAVTDRTGKKIDWEDSSDWNGDGINDWVQVGKLAEECGLEWGGNWSSMPDFPHFQDRMGLTIQDLKSGKRP